MYKNKIISHIILILMLFTFLNPIPVTHATALDNVLTTLAASTVPDQGNTTNNGTGIFQKIFSFIFDKIIGPVVHVFNGKTASSPTTANPVVITPMPQPMTGFDTLKDKIIVLDPGHGGSNPGAVANNTRESDNNLAVGLKLRDKLVQAGAKVIMTRDTDRTVAPEGSSLDTELQARLDITENNHANIFVSLHSNENSDTSIAGATTFYPNGKSSLLASEVESALVTETGATNKGTSPANFYVLRNNSAPSTLIEMGFVSNKEEAALLNSDSYRTKLAQGIFNGIIKYFNN